MNRPACLTLLVAPMLVAATPPRVPAPIAAGASTYELSCTK